jgi:hypothetical protein
MFYRLSEAQHFFAIFTDHLLRAWDYFSALRRWMREANRLPRRCAACA